MVSATEPVKVTTRTCKYCGRAFRVVRGQAKRKGCPDCQPPLFDLRR